MIGASSALIRENVGPDPRKRDRPAGYREDRDRPALAQQDGAADGVARGSVDPVRERGDVASGFGQPEFRSQRMAVAGVAFKKPQRLKVGQRIDD